MSGQELQRRTLPLVWGVWLGTAIWLLLVAVVLVPAWQQRQEAAEQLAALERELAAMADVAQGLTAAEQAVQGRWEEVRLQEAQLLPPGGDVGLIRQIERLAGESTVVTAIRAGTAVPLAAADGAADSRDRRSQSQREGAGTAAVREQSEAEPAPYWQVNYQIEAEGPWSELRTYLQRLETELPGLRVNAVQWHRSQAGGETWRLSAACAVYTVRRPLADP